MSTKTPKTILFGTPIGAVAGAVAGYYMPQQMLELSFLGQIFVNVLWIVAVPLIIAAVAVGIGSLGNGQRIRQMAGSGLLYFVGTTVIAILIGVAVAGVMGPGVGLEAEGATPPDQVVQAQQVTLNGLMNTLVPRSLVQAVASGEYFVFILAALFFGTALATMGHRRRLILDILRSISEVLQKLVRWIMWAAPIGVFFLTATLFANQPGLVEGITGNIGMFLLALLIGLALHSLVVLPLLLRYLGNRPPLEYLGKLVPALANAFGTGSSMATLPVTHQCVVGDSRVDNRAAALMLPLGATINIGGTIMFVMMAAMFVSQMMPDQVGVMQIVTIAVGALVMSLAMASVTNIPGIPGAGLLIIAILFRVADMPDAAYGALALLAGMEWLVHRACTAVNVWSDAVGASVIAVRVNRQFSRPTSDRSPRGGVDRKRAVTKDDSRRDRRDQRRPGGRGGRPDDRRQRPSRDRREAPKTSATELHRAKDSSSPFALKQDNVVDLGAVPDKRTSRYDSPRRGSSRAERPSSDGGRQRHGDQSDRPSRSRSRRPDSARNGNRRGPDRDTRRPQPQDRQPREHKEDLRQEHRRPESRPPQDQSAVKREENLDQRTLNREKARVEAQLADMKRKERTLPVAPTAPVAEIAPSEPFDSPVIDYSSPDMADSKAREKPASEAAVDAPPPSPKPAPETTPEARSEPAEEKPAVTFGRRRRTSGQKRPSGSKEGSDQSNKQDTPEADSNVEEEEVTATSFGRAKKKRTRR